MIRQRAREAQTRKSCFCNQRPVFGHQGVHLENLTSACFERWDCLFQGKFADFNITGLMPRGKFLKTEKCFVFFFTLAPSNELVGRLKCSYSLCFYSKNVATYKLTSV